jgi:FdhD protein
MRSLTHVTEPPAVLRTPMACWDGSERHLRHDLLAVEEPLEIRLAGGSVTVTMRTPGDDFDLAVGFLLTENIIHGMDDVALMAHCPDEDGNLRANIVNVTPRDWALVDPTHWQRNFYATSSCGICGKASIEGVRQDLPPLRSMSVVSSRTIRALPDTLRAAQTVFAQTGGLHAAGLFDVDGRLQALREDVGRHNAVDKLIGSFVRCGEVGADRLLHDRILLVSGRASFEIVQKGLMAGIPILISVSAPSSLAVDLARSSGMTLVGFVRGSRFNVYAGDERIGGDGA